MKRYEFRVESVAMRLFRWLALESFAWSLRRLHCPVDGQALVLEVGSGGNPYFRSNVLLDAYENTGERHWVPLVTDRPTVLGFVENLPFRDKAFDFVIASHVLEHSSDPARFLAELERVAKAGYIESPDAFMERINPYKDHRLEVTLRNDCLLIRKKHAWICDAELVELYEQRAKNWVTQRLIPDYPFDFHVRYYWKDQINFRILNPETDASWQPVITDRSSEQLPIGGIKQNMRCALLRIIRWMFSQSKRNRRSDLLSLLCCPKCHGGEFSRQHGNIVCERCFARYEVQQGVFVMQTRKSGIEK